MSTARWPRTVGVGLLLVVLLATAAGAAAPAGGSVSASDAGSIDIGVDAPETVPTDQSATATVTASGATGGVDVFELTLAASGSEATLEDVSVLTDGTAGPLTDIQYGPNDQTVTVRVTTLDATYENASTISLFDADVSNGENGTVDLAVTGVSTVQDASLEPYTIGQTSGTQIEFTGDTQAPTDSIDIPNKTLPADGGTITVSNQSADAYLQLDTSELPEGWTVSDPQPIGFAFTQNESTWLYPVPGTVSLNITPANESVAQSGTITATVDDIENQDTFTVTIGDGGSDDGPPASTPVPEDVAQPAVVNAVITAGPDSELDTLDILDGYADYLETGAVNGTEVETGLTLLDLYSWRLDNPGVEVGPVDPDGGTDEEPDDIIGGPDDGNETDDELPDGNETDDGGNETDDDAPDDPDADEPTAASPLTIEQTLGAADADNSINAIAVAHGLTNGSAPVNLSEMTWTVTTPDGTTTLDYDDVQAQSAAGTSEPPLLESSGDVIQVSFGLELNGLPPLEAGEDVTIEANPPALDDDGGTPTESVSVTGTTPSSIQSGESYVL
ncbi:hypothetical protein HKK80_11335 [Halonotius sp. F2-221B]|uniref:hypothetical protein n=1 Tax=Halonotius sp. F2-221B TaxID=2731620 RepID=UPI00398A5EA1